MPETTAANWLIWSFEHDAWWRPRSEGYTRSVTEAGRYTGDEACDILSRCGVGNEIPVHVDGASDDVWPGNSWKVKRSGRAT